MVKITLLFFLIHLLVAYDDRPKCADKDLLVAYGVCENDKRDILFYLSSACNGSEFKLPDAVRDKPCNFVCGEGAFFNYHSGECETCPAGTTPQGRTLLYSEWLKIPEEFKLENDSRGKPWEALGYYITARDQPALSTTSFSVNVNILASNGTVTFSYEASPDSQLSAPLYFFIDGKIPDGLDNSLSARVWKEVTFNLTFGSHNLTWRYETSTFHNSSDEGPKIRYIEVTGTHYLSIQCVECKPGEYSRNGTCYNCERGDYSNTSGSVNCEPCPKGTTSFPGATKCHFREACTEHDFTYYLTDCVAENTTVRKRLYKWLEPVHCDPYAIKATKLPEPTTEECAKCDPGTYRPHGSAVCVPCPEGTFRSEKVEDDIDEGEEVYDEESPDETGEGGDDSEPDLDADEDPVEGKRKGGKKGKAANRNREDKTGKKGPKGKGLRKRKTNEDTDDDSKCYECGAGYHAAYVKYIKHVEKILDVFSSTTCISDSDDEGDCASYGWRAMEDYLDSGNFHAGPVQVVLTLDLNSTGTTTSYIEFDFTTHLLNGSRFKYFTTNGLSVVFDASANEQGTIRRRIELDQLDTNITWVFQKGWDINKKLENRESDYVRIERIVVHGVENANSGATECRKCPAGTHSPPKSKHCNYCGEGHFAPEGSYECLKCDNDSYTSRKGQGECFPCGNFTHASDDRKTCVFDECGFYFNETHEFDLSELVEPEGMLGPLFSFDGNTRYFFNLCDKNSSKLLCADYAGNSVDAYACQMQYTSRPVSLGNKMSFNLYDDPESGNYGVTITFYDGDLCRAQHSSADSSSSTSTVLAAGATDAQRLAEAEKAQRRMQQLFSNVNKDVSKRIVAAAASGTEAPLSAEAVSALLGVSTTPSASFSSLSSSSSSSDSISFPFQLSGVSQEIPRSATLNMICLPGSGFGMPVLSSPAEFPACNFNFEWVTEYACKLCQYEDIVNVSTGCRHKQRNVSYHYDKNARCSRGVPLPDDVVLKCKRMLRIGLIEALIIVTIILVVVLTALIFICVLCRKNRELKYKILQNDNKETLVQATSMMDDNDDGEVQKEVHVKKKKKKTKKGKSQFAEKTQSRNDTNPSLFSVGEEQV